MATKCVLIGGGTGFVGKALSKHLKSINIRPVVISRNPSGNDDMRWEDVRLKGFPKNCIGAINLAGANIGNPLSFWTPAFKKEIYDSRINTTKTLAKLFIDHCDTKRVFITSSAIGYYPPSDVTIYNEQSKVDSSTDYFSSMCRDWEEAGTLPTTTIHRHVTIRTGVVLGRTGGMIQQIYVPFSLGLGGPLASGKQPFAWIHVEDIVGIFVHALTNDHVIGVLNGVAPTLTTNAEFTEALGAALNRPTIFRVPELALNLVYGKERASMMIKGQKVLPDNTIASGYKFKYPTIQEATEELVNG